MEESKIIAKITKDENGKDLKEQIFISLSEFKNSKFIDLRKFYQEDEEWKPTKKGITMNINQIDQLIKLINENRKEIESWFNK